MSIYYIYFTLPPEVHHNTPETQTDESYNHPEDIEHFAMHAAIEKEEEARERRFQGIPDEPLNPSSPSSNEAQTPPADKPEAAPDVPIPPHPHDDQKAFGVSNAQGSDKSKIPQREVPPEKRPPEQRYGQAANEARTKEEWGQGPDGYKPPRTPADKMRKNLPYKVSSFVVGYFDALTSPRLALTHSFLKFRISV